jgi:hypothetical protein
LRNPFVRRLGAMRTDYDETSAITHHSLSRLVAVFKKTGMRESMLGA